MKSDYTIQQWAQRITDRAERKVDLIADTRSVQYDPQTNKMHVGQHELSVNDHAHGQIATQTGIPALYYKRMREDAPALLGENIRTWFDKYPANRMIRALDNTARAWLSDKYNRMDDDAFANVVMPAVYDVPGASIESCGMTDLKTTIKFVSPRLTYQVRKGDDVQFGVAYSNSEVGAGRLTGTLFAKQLVCLNGMCIEAEMFASTHVGRRHTTRDLGEIFQLDTLKADGAATILKLRDYTKELLTDRFLTEQVEKMRGSKSSPDVRPTQAVSRSCPELRMARRSRSCGR